MVATSSSEWFLYGNYLSIGISQYGTFGTYNSCTSSICTWGWTSILGLRQDHDGWGQGDSPGTGDFFLPGTKYYMWCIGYRTTENGSFTYLCNDRKSNSQQMTGVTITDASDSSEKIAGVTMQWSNSVIQVDSTYSFHACSKKILISAKITNLGSGTMYDPSYLIGLDPDNDKEAGGSYSTINSIQGQKSQGDDYTSVCAEGSSSGISLCMSSTHPRSYGYRGLSFSDNPLNNEPGDSLQSSGGSATTEDKALALVTYGSNSLAQNEQSENIGMYFGLGAVDDVKLPNVEKCT